MSFDVKKEKSIANIPFMQLKYSITPIHTLLLVCCRSRVIVAVPSVLSLLFDAVQCCVSSASSSPSFRSRVDITRLFHELTYVTKLAQCWTLRHGISPLLVHNTNSFWFTPCGYWLHSYYYCSHALSDVLILGSVWIFGFSMFSSPVPDV